MKMLKRLGKKENGIDISDLSAISYIIFTCISINPILKNKTFFRTSHDL
jgi:hypothetical protein